MESNSRFNQSQRDDFFDSEAEELLFPGTYEEAPGLLDGSLLSQSELFHYLDDFNPLLLATGPQQNALNSAELVHQSDFSHVTTTPIVLVSATNENRFDNKTQDGAENPREVATLKIAQGTAWIRPCQHPVLSSHTTETEAKDYFLQMCLQLRHKSKTDTPLWARSTAESARFILSTVWIHLGYDLLQENRLSKLFWDATYTETGVAKFQPSTLVLRKLTQVLGDYEYDNLKLTTIMATLEDAWKRKSMTRPASRVYLKELDITKAFRAQGDTSSVQDYNAMGSRNLVGHHVAAVSLPHQLQPHQLSIPPDSIHGHPSYIDDQVYVQQPCPINDNGFGEEQDYPIAGSSLEAQIIPHEQLESGEILRSREEEIHCWHLALDEDRDRLARYQVKSLEELNRAEEYHAAELCMIRAFKSVKFGPRE